MTPTDDERGHLPIHLPRSLLEKAKAAAADPNAALGKCEKCGEEYRQNDKGRVEHECPKLLPPTHTEAEDAATAAVDRMVKREVTRVKPFGYGDDD